MAHISLTKLSRPKQLQWLRNKELLATAIFLFIHHYNGLLSLFLLLCGVFFKRSSTAERSHVFSCQVFSTAITCAASFRIAWRHALAILVACTARPPLLIVSFH